jgi:hypothetical protein
MLAPNDRNFWEQYQTGDGFLDFLKDTSLARQFCRQFISENIKSGAVQSLTEIGFGGLNEYLSLEQVFSSSPGFRYVGLDWTQNFVDSARRRFPERTWERCDITQYVTNETLRSDLAYSQHVLEHLTGLEPALSNLLFLAKKALINIFFLPPRKDDEVINFAQYPLYHNFYSAKHIKKVCERHRFDAKMIWVNNRQLENFGKGLPPDEVVLIALRKEEGDSSPVSFHYDAFPDL